MPRVLVLAQDELTVLNNKVFKRKARLFIKSENCRVTFNKKSPLFRIGKAGKGYGFPSAVDADLSLIGSVVFSLEGRPYKLPS